MARNVQTRRITDADERITLAFDILTEAAKRLADVRLRLQAASSNEWVKVTTVEDYIDEAIDMLENGY